MMQTESPTEIATRPETPPIVSGDAQNSLLNFVAQAVSDPNIDVNKLDVLLRMQREIVADQSKVTFNRALHAAQSEIPHITKNGTVTLGKAGENKGSYNFTTWEDMDKVLRPIMARHGFTLSFDMETKEGGGAVVKGTLLHVDGHSKSASIPLALDAGAGRNNLQAMGSTMSYGRRYVTEMLFNLVRKGADDDGKLGGTEFLTNEQVLELQAMVLDTNTDEGRFLSMMTSEARSLEEVEAKDFPRLKNALLAKKKQARGAPA